MIVRAYVRIHGVTLSEGSCKWYHRYLDQVHKLVIIECADKLRIRNQTKSSHRVQITQHLKHAGGFSLSPPVGNYANFSG